MKRTLVTPNIDEIHPFFHSLIKNTAVYDSSCSPFAKVWYIEKDGVRVGIVNVCEHEYTYATENREGARPFDEFETMADIREAKRSSDKVIVIYHGGKELCRYPSPRLMKACREMVRCGADVVFCQHSHCIGCFETFEGGHILYGQGNFHFPDMMDTEMWNEGLIASLDITKDDVKVEYIPVKSTHTGIRLATNEEKDQVISDLLVRNGHIQDGSWIEGWRAFCQSEKHNYVRAMVGKFGGRESYTMEDNADQYQLFAHYLDCEAHTDVWRELYKTYNSTNEM